MQLSARTRSSRRPNLISYCEDDLGCSTSYSDPSSSSSASVCSDFPKAPTKPKYEVNLAKIPKNNNNKMFYSNFLYKSFCLLCGCSDKNLAVHYARKHPNTEVFIARVSPNQGERIRKQQNEFLQVDGKIHGLCSFCEDLKTMNRVDWMKHLLNHTGESMFFCTGCDMSMIRNHKHGKCSREKVQNIFDNNSSSDGLVGFICNTCNYLQVREQQLVKHVSVEHDFFDENCSELFSKVVLVKSPV